MNRWLGPLATAWLVLAPICTPLTAQDTTQARAPDTTATLRPVPTVTLSLAEAMRQARGNSPA
ncbi:MAG: hypothetical protein L0214_08590, partial [candidate division NC10 bacterium]|nr:hypothetical protein [candidate division NC10 bacterium]